MPCCYGRTADDAPQGVRQHLGKEMAADVGRSFRLQAAGYRVDWDHVPAAITPMNRILIGWHPR